MRNRQQFPVFFVKHWPTALPGVPVANACGAVQVAVLMFQIVLEFEVSLQMETLTH